MLMSHGESTSHSLEGSIQKGSTAQMRSKCAVDRCPKGLGKNGRDAARDRAFKPCVGGVAGRDREAGPPGAPGARGLQGGVSVTVTGAVQVCCLGTPSALPPAGRSSEAHLFQGSVGLSMNNRDPFLKGNFGRKSFRSLDGIYI